MERKSRFGVVLLLVFTLTVGVVAGGIVGGGAGYLIASRVKPAVSTAANPVPALPVSNVERPVAAPAAADDATVVGVVNRVAPAVVTVVNSLSAEAAAAAGQPTIPFPFGEQPQDPRQQQDQPQPRATGSGVIISQDGYIITNNHVVEGQQSLAVYFVDGTRHDATLVGTDPLMDIAVLKITDPVPVYAPLADSDAIQPGETAIAIGSPLGSFRNSVTVGVVSAVNRSVPGSSMEGLIQTDAAINNGNSGGPLLNLRGEVIGINTLVVRGTGMSEAAAEGLGFSVPSNIVRSVSDQLIASGKVEYPFLGVSYTPIDPERAAAENLPVQNGALVESSQDGRPAVTPGSAADKAGLREGDIITAIGDDQLGIDKSLRQALLQHKPGDVITLGILRDGEPLTIDVTLGVRPANT